ncbi:MAG: hybrid sensor histidine kinase/response regulator, partial [Bacteroidetes bacterium]|nr:hybrid sensor histidine kinase/response regulator [Bacteroidota bacterium]
MDENRINVLYVDDENSNIIGFKATFRTKYNVVGVTDVAAALETLESQEFQIIIADQKMPNMTGIEFFEIVLKKFPDPIRILITGYADTNDTIDAINKGEIFRYVLKPWSEDELSMAIQNAYEVFKQKREIINKNEQLQKAYEELNRFVYSASHDMRAPLMSILGIVKVARLDHPDENMQNYLNLIESSVQQLNSFNSNLIDYYTNSKEHYEIEEVNFKDLITEITQNYQYYPGADKIKINVKVDQANIFRVDVFRLRVVLNNLVSNAIKFHVLENDDRHINIEITTNDNQAIIIIEDNGQGIGEEH